MKDDQELFNKLFKINGDLIVSTGIYEDVKRRLRAIKAEITTYHKRSDKESKAWFTVETIEDILKMDLSQFKEDSEK